MEWSALCEEFSRCVVSAESAADNVGRAANDDGVAGDDEALAVLTAELDGALTSLNRKLIELHSRVKGRNPLSTIDPFSFLGSGTDCRPICIYFLPLP